MFTTLASFAASTAAYLWPTKNSVHVKPINLGPASRLGDGQVKAFVRDGRPALVINSDGKFYAMSATCTHLSCTVKWNPDKQEIECPCHGGAFDAQGRPLRGPVKKPLRQFEVMLRNDNIIVGGPLP